MRQSSLAEYLNSRKTENINRLRALVEIESGSYDKSGVDQAGKFMAAELEKLGFRIESIPQTRIGDVIHGHKAYGGNGRVLILGHLDTVWPKGTLTDWPFSIHPDGFATGPGVGDMKGGLIVALAAVEALGACDLCPLGSIAFLLIPDEELGSPISRPIIERIGAEADWVLVMEPGRTNGGVVTSRGAVASILVRSHGRTAHTGNNFKEGISAIRELASKIERLECLSDPEKGLIVNIGIFRGGDARQVVPGSAEMHIDVRAPSDDGMQGLISRLRSIVLTAANPEVKVSIEGGQTRPAFPRTAGVQSLYSRIAEIAAEMKISLPENHTFAGSDGSFTAALGIPTIDGLGPVTLDVCNRRERIYVESLHERSVLVARFLTRIRD